MGFRERLKKRMREKYGTSSIMEAAINAKAPKKFKKKYSYVTIAICIIGLVMWGTGTPYAILIFIVVISIWGLIVGRFGAIERHTPNRGKK